MLSLIRSDIAEEAVAKTPVCLECLEAAGLCRRCGRSILPALKKPSWVWSIYFKYYGADVASRIDERASKAVEKAKRRNARKARRVSTLIAGGFAPAARRAA